MLSGERMPPLTLGSGRTSPSSLGSFDPFEGSIGSSSDVSGGGSGGNGVSYITCIDFFVPLDLACGPPDDLSHATTPRRFGGTDGHGSAGAGSGSSNSPASSGSPLSSSQQRGGPTSPQQQQQQRKRPRGPRSLRSLLFDERPMVSFTDHNKGYTPTIEYLKGSSDEGAEAVGKKSPAAASSSATSSPLDGVLSNDSFTNNSAFARTGDSQPRFSSSGYLVPASPPPGASSSPSSAVGAGGSGGPSPSSPSGQQLTMSPTKPRAVVDGIECMRYNLIDREHRQEVATNLRDICQRLGPRRARRMVLPALDLLFDFEDTTLLIAQALPAIFAACEGATHAHLFVSLIYDLCSAPDPLVAVEAAAAVKTILTEARDGAKAVLDHFFPVLSDMTFSPYASLRCSSALVMALLARLAATEEERSECLQNYRYLCGDTDVSVRRSALSTLHEWLAVVPSAEWARFPLGLVDGFLAEKNHDTVRIQLVEVIVRLAARVGKYLAAKHLLPPTVALAADRSWRVRFVLASHIGFLFDALAGEAGDLMPTVLRLANDEEVQVRVSAARQIGTIAAVAPAATVETTLVDAVRSLGNDASPEVRAGVAKSIGPVVAACAPAVGRPLILDVMVPLLSDTAVPLVQHTAIMSMAAMAPLMAERSAGDIYSLVVVQLETASRSSTWRVRESVANLLHHFAGHVRSAEQFDELMPIMMRLINDDSSAVRCAVVRGIPHTVARLGPAWAVRTLGRLLDMLVEPQRSKFYQRIQACTILGACLPILAKDMSAPWQQQQQQHQTQRVGNGSGLGSTIGSVSPVVSPAVVVAGQPLSNGIASVGSGGQAAAAAAFHFAASPVSQAIVASPLSVSSSAMTASSASGAVFLPPAAQGPFVGIEGAATALVSPSSDRALPASPSGPLSSASSASQQQHQQQQQLPHFSRLANDVRVAFNERVRAVISRLVTDKVLSVREACARLLVSLSDEAPDLFTAECEAWAAAIVLADGYEPAKDIILRAGIPVGASAELPQPIPPALAATTSHTQEDTNPF